MVAPITFGGGITIGGGIAVGNPSTPPAPSGTTYTEGVDYTGTGISFLGPQQATIAVIGANKPEWTDTANYDILGAMPVGTSISVDCSGTIYTGTTTQLPTPTSADTFQFTATMSVPIFPGSITSFTFY